MYYVIEQNKRNEKNNMLSVIRMEIDYELVTLHDAIKLKNDEDIQKSKRKLESLVKQLNEYTTQDSS